MLRTTGGMKLRRIPDYVACFARSFVFVYGSTRLHVWLQLFRLLCRLSKNSSQLSSEEGQHAIAKAALELSPDVLDDFWDWFYSR